MKYRQVIVTKFGGPEVLQVVEQELQAPPARQVRLKVLAAAVCRGEALYSCTSLAPELC